MRDAAVMKGFPSLPWDQRGKCYVSTTLDELSHAELTQEGFEKMIEEFFLLGESREPAL